MNEHNRLWPLRLVLVLVSGVTGGITAMLFGHHSSQPVLGSYSVPAATALLISVASFVTAVLLAASPNQKLLQFKNWFRDGTRSLQVEPPRGTRQSGLFLGVLALVSFVWLAIRFLAANPEAVDDQLDYLTVATDIQRMGGPAELWGRLWTGTYLEANRHPLYTTALSFCPSFTIAKSFSTFLGGLALVILWWGARRCGNWLIGGIAAVLLATNGTFQDSSTMVACEMLLTCWVLLAWFAVERCVGADWKPTNVQPSTGRPADPPSDFTKLSLAAPWVQSGFVGLWLGLAYLTKASGLFLLVGFQIWSLLVPRLRPWSWVALVVFLLVASPLLVRNARAFGDPLYSFNTRFLFADSFEQGLQRDFRGTWIEAREYLNSHSSRAIAQRALSGLGWEGFILLRSLGPAAMGESRPLVGLVVLLFSVIGTIATDRRLVWAATIWTAIFYFFFAWYVPIAAGDRFLAPIVAVILFFSARGAVILIASNSPNNAQAAARWVILAASLWCITMLMLSLKVTPTTKAGHVLLIRRVSSGQFGLNPIENSLRRDVLRPLKLQGD